MKKFLALTLCLVMLVSTAVALNIGASAYNAGDVILDESKINSDTKAKEALDDKIGTTELSWNATTGRLHVKAKGQGIITVKGFDPDSTDKYTISGDFYVKDAVSVTGSQPRFGLGIYSNLGNNATGWTNGAFVFFQGEGAKGWNTTAVKRYVDGSKVTGATWNVEQGVSENATGLTNGSELLNYAKKVSFKIVVDPSSVDAPIKAYHDDVLVKSADKLPGSKAGELFLYTRNCEFEVDNLKVSYDGTGSGAGTVTLTTSTFGTKSSSSSSLTLPPVVDKVYYPDGTIILNEDMIKADVAGNVKSATVKDATKYSFTWNEANGKLKMSTTGGNMVAELVKVPAGLDHYTITGKFTMLENNWGNKAMMGLGINSAGAWSKSTYVDAQIFNNGDYPKIYVDSTNIEGAGSAGRGNVTMSDRYVYGTTEYTFKIVVEVDCVSFYVNDTFISIMMKAAVPYPANVPTIILRDKCTIEIDDLMVYSGTGSPDPTKVIGQVDPIPAPESTVGSTSSDTTEATTEATTTTPEATTTKATTTAATTEEKKSGCGSSLGMGIVAIATAVCTTGVVCRRKRK